MILCFGEISWDRLLLVDKIPKQGGQAFVNKEVAIPGGCSLNTAVHLAMMKEQVLLGGNDIGFDIYGDQIRNLVDKAGIKFISKQTKDQDTPRCDCLIDSDTKERSFLLYHEGIQDFRPDMFEEIPIDEIDVAFVDPYLKEASCALLELIQGRCKKIWLQDLKPDDPRVALGDIVQISLDESLHSNHDMVKSIGKKYFRGRCSTVFATVGKYGAFLVRSDGLFIFGEPREIASASPRNDGGDCFASLAMTEEIASASPRNDDDGALLSLRGGPKVRRSNPVVDTTGCGDAFRAGAMRAWNRNNQWEEILYAGIELGTYQATIFGSNPILGLTKL